MGDQDTDSAGAIRRGESGMCYGSAVLLQRGTVLMLLKSMCLRVIFAGLCVCLCLCVLVCEDSLLAPLLQMCASFCACARGVRVVVLQRLLYSRVYKFIL